MLVGPNGCGKSTLLKVLGGLTRADRGMCHVLPPAGFVFQNPDHQVVMPTVGADVAFGLGRSAFQFSICVLLFLYAVSNYAMLCSFFMLQVLSGVISQFRAACRSCCTCAKLSNICRYKLKEDHVRAHVDRMLEAVNLPGFAKRQTHTLSGGQKQRVAIAGALAECPKVH